MNEKDLLQARAAQLALPLHEDQKPQGNPMLLVEAGPERYALPLQHIDVVRTKPPLTSLPGVPNTLAGLVNLQGHVLAVLDLSALMGHRPQVQAGHIVVVCVTQNQKVALQVQQVHGVVDVPEQLSRSTSGRAGIRGVWDAHVTVLDVLELLQHFQSIPSIASPGGNHEVI